MSIDETPRGLPAHLRRRTRPDWGGQATRELFQGAALLVALEDPDARMPLQERAGDAGMDLYVSRPARIQPGQFADIDCGIALQLPAGHWARITGRSSTLRRRGLLVNEAVIDNGYTGPIYTGVWNLGAQPVDVAVGERLAQLILHPIVRVPVVAATELVSRDGRGSAGFGSSGR